MSLEDNPKLKNPFDHGWRRELVQRAAASAEDHRPVTAGIRADAYYFSPQGKKLRSIKEMETYLKQSGSPLDVACFSFRRHLLGVGPPMERLRKARPMGPAVGTAVRKTAAAKKIQRKKHTITIGGASSVIKLPSPSAANPQKMQRKHSLMEKSRKAFAFKARELKKKMPVFQSEAVKPKPVAGAAAQQRRGRLPGPGAPAAAGRGRMLLRRPWLLVEVDEWGAVCCMQPPDAAVTSDYFRLVRAPQVPHTADHVLVGRARQPAPCSLFCFVESPLARLALPSAQCLICRCLSHPVCVGLEDANITSFVCVDCHAGVNRGRGFDGVGDSVDGDSGSESDGAADSGEELVLAGGVGGPPPPPLLLGAPRFGAPSPFSPGMKRPRGRPRLSGPRQPRPGVMRGAYARRRGMGGGRGSRGPRSASGLPRPAIPGDAVPAGPGTFPPSDSAMPAGPGTFPLSGAAVPVSPPAAAAAKKRSWRDP